ncbi:MAG: GIY-YIG nuclease family protein [Chryseolinea sp.]
MYHVYIIYSESLQLYYVGSTSNLASRLYDHNHHKSKFTSKGMPWILIKSFDRDSNSDALRLEKKIKSRGAKRYLDDIGFTG